MTATRPSPLAPEARPPRRRRRWLWLAPAALLALVPKCPLCVVAWTLAAVGLGLGTPELCGGSPAPPAAAGWIALAAALALVIGTAAWICRRQRSARGRRATS